MATTTYHEFDAAARGIGNRTDSAGVAVGDITAEEDRLVQAVITEGAVTTNAFVVQATGANMDITVGSGSAKADLFAVAGEVAGQGVYLARLDQTPVTITVPAAEASQVRNDEVYLVIADNAYDAGGVSLPRIGYRKGDAGGAAPGPDASWQASALLATVNVTAATTTIEQADITDERATAEFTLVPPDLVSTSGADMAGPLTFIDDGSESFRLEFGEVSTPERFQIFADDRGYLNFYADTNGDGTADIASLQILADGSIEAAGNNTIGVENLGPNAVATKGYADKQGVYRSDTWPGNGATAFAITEPGTYIVVASAYGIVSTFPGNAIAELTVFMETDSSTWFSLQPRQHVWGDGYGVTITFTWKWTKSDSIQRDLMVNLTSFSGAMAVQQTSIAVWKQPV